MPRTTLTSKGQLTLPKAIRQQLRLETGDQIDFAIDEAGHLLGIPVRQTGSTVEAGSLHHLAKDRPVSLEEMDSAIRNRYRVRKS